MEPFAPTSVDPAFEGPSADEEPPRLGWLVSIAAGAVIVGGMFALGYAAQLLVFIRFYDWSVVVPWMIGALALALLALGGWMLSGRPVAATAASVLCALQVVFALAWNVWALVQTLYSPLGMLWALVALPVALLAPLAIGPSLRHAAWRKKLMADLE